ncbi:MAG: glycosyltransferase family 2 protein [Candidatus Margulisiibacteriota bacterium]
MDLAKKHNKSLAICMIVKNEQESLPKTISNNIKYSDKVILVDTGSDDSTVNIAKELGAEIYHFKWNNNFADARNFSISKAKEDWILWLDADEYIDELSFKAIRGFLDGTEADVVRIPIYECQYGETNGDSFYMRDKIFRNNKGACFTKSANEQLVFPENTKVSVVDFLGARICHWGLHLSAEAMEKKMGPRIELLKKIAAENREDYSVRYLLGMRYSEMKLPQEALGYYSQAVSICEKEASTDRQKKYFMHAALAKKAQILLESGHGEEALAEALAAIKLDPMFLEPCDTAAMALIKLGKYEEALELTEQMLKLPKIQHPVLMFNEQKWGSLIYVLHIRALLKAIGKAAAISFAEGILKNKPDNIDMAQMLDIIKTLEIIRGMP